MGIFFWDFETFNKRSKLLVVNQFLQTNMNVSVANFKYKNYGIQNYQHSFSVLLYNIAKSKKANLPVSRTFTRYFNSRRRSRDSALKTLFWLSKVLLDLLEKHSKRRCKICICSVILGELECIRNYKGLRIIFPKILDEI